MLDRETQGSREKLFDLAVNRALGFSKKMGFIKKMGKLTAIDENLSQITEDDLTSWHKQTRFAYRISLKDIVRCINELPDLDVDYYWQGGVSGSWLQGKTPHP